VAALVRPSLNAPGTPLTATYLLQTFVGVAGASLTGQLILNANASSRAPGPEHSANAEASGARYYVDAPSGVTLSWASGHDYATPTAASVPEPETWALMLSGLIAMGYLARRMRATAFS